MRLLNFALGHEAPTLPLTIVSSILPYGIRYLTLLDSTLPVTYRPTCTKTSDVTKSPVYHVTALPRYRITTLLPYHVTALPRIELFTLLPLPSILDCQYRHTIDSFICFFLLLTLHLPLPPPRRTNRSNRADTSNWSTFTPAFLGAYSSPHSLSRPNPSPFGSSSS